MVVLLVALEQRGYTVRVAGDEGATPVRTPEGGVPLRLSEHVERRESVPYRTARELNRYAYVELAKRWTRDYVPDQEPLASVASMCAAREAAHSSTVGKADTSPLVPAWSRKRAAKKCR